MSTHTDFQAGFDAYNAGEDESVLHGKSAAFDRGFWAAHDESYVPDTGGIEEGYGDYLDYDAVSQGFYDDDPNPYDGTYSEM